MILSPNVPLIDESERRKLKMKVKRNRITINFFLSGLMFPFMLFGCGVKPEKAQEILAEQNIPYTVEACAEHIKDNDVSTVQLFLQAGMGPDTLLFIDGEEMLPLSYAAANNSMDVAKLLIREGAVVDKTDESGRTALMIASKHNAIDMAQLLISNGADVNAKDKSGWTAFFMAMMSSSIEAAELLVANGADVNAKDPAEGAPALMWASRQNAYKLTELLLKKGSDINAQDKRGWSALMIAAFNNYIDMTELLIKNGADVNAQRSDGWTVLAIATSKGNTEIVELLKRAGAKSEGDSKPYSKQRDSESQEEKLEGVLGGIRLMPEVSWLEIDRNDVYVGFKKFPNDINQLIRAWALQGSREINFGVHVWAIENVSSGWRPGQSGHYITITARDGRIK
jgi:ankyrin repeat protein